MKRDALASLAALATRAGHGGRSRGLEQGHGQPWGRKRRRASVPWIFLYLQLLAVASVLALLVQPAHAVFINFDNCLDPNIIQSEPLQLQFIPLYVDAVFNTSSASHNLNVTIYGNVSGQAVEGTYPAATDSSWTDPNSTFGKIVDVSPTNNKYSTLFQRYQVLTYDAYNAPASEFCQSVINGSCPLAPSFSNLGGNYSDPYSLSTFSIAHDFYSSYSFATFASTIRVQSGDSGAPDLACISASITPDLGSTLSGLLRYLPVAVLIFVAIATASAAICSPWGSSDIFKWTTNYGRDEDLLRLVTPGFGDCLQYIQFIFLTGALTLDYPGYFQPVTSKDSWSALLFNESFVTHGPGTQSLIDGIYFTNGSYGMTKMSQLVGMTAMGDTWACMAIWLVVVCAAAVLLCQLGFVMRWILRALTNAQEEDLRRKNWPLSGGMVVRIIFGYFLLPVVSISMFQLVVAARSPASVVVCAVILLLAIILLSGWILYVIFRAKPRAFLFDDLPTVLLYGSLYNTYSDEAAPFALIPALLTFIRGVAIGAVQPSGIAQIIVLAICEVVLILTLHAFRPFHSPTHMNAYHTFFAAARLACVLLMVAFVPSLGVTEAPKGWIGYAILLIHAIVLVFGFFLNALQTLIEVFARMAGAGGDPQHGAQRGGLVSYGWRQLSKKKGKRGRPGSMTSDAAILANDDAKSLNGRTRSMSASSQLMLNQHLPSSRMSGMDQYQDYALTPDLDANSPFNTLPSSSGSIAGQGKRPILGIKTEQPLQDPYYRPPRARRNTGDLLTPGVKSRYSGEWNRAPYVEPEENNSGEGPALSPPNADEERASSPWPSYLRDSAHARGVSDPDLTDLAAPRTDYAVREVDFYYGVRGPALSNAPARKLKTGPADPMGPVSNATSWFQRLFKGKTKEKGKGFEVVRSSRMPPNMMEPRGVQRSRAGPNDDQEGQELQTSPPMHYAPYHDSPPSTRNGPQAVAGAERSHSASPESRRQPGSRRGPSGIATRLDGTWDDSSSESDLGESRPRSTSPTSPSPYRIPPILRTRSISLDADARAEAAPQNNFSRPTPNVPRRSSRRTSSAGGSASDFGMSPPMPMNTFGSTTDRPTSLGNVSHRMTGDSMGFADVGQAAGEGKAAEIVTDPRAASISSQGAAGPRYEALGSM